MEISLPLFTLPINTSTKLIVLEVYDVDKMEFYTDIEIPSYMVNLHLSLSGDGKTVMVIYQYPDDISEVYKKLDSGWEKISGALDTFTSQEKPL